jgi:uncharacterized protein (DUF983 family)
MAKTWLLVILFIVAVVIGYGMFSIWNSLAPSEWQDDSIKYGVAIVMTLASFACLYFMTKGGGE